ncbi:DUF397 domain-containing protein [Nocardiopsis sp. MG754419]|uniref:DUF397 domain-containing protein n=1 Tax=Nocardiopsis sp. MG754419 TaxID=2259865 RepID=UPI001BA6B02B|nr:DUF397 domain-containing protein [Nocardiopsis sp. MG754419]MBR8741744.1 DUF397 domain-containing protein [Nocardiopsis sp. MG754419]
MNDRSTGAWHTSSHSGARGDCVEVSEGGVTGIRDTRHRDHGHLEVGAFEWTALLETLAPRR